MRVAGLTGVQLGPEDDPTGLLVRTYDPDALGGLGAVDLTEDLQEARKFQTIVEVRNTWAAQSNVRPLRADGLPNRPLTAYTVEPVQVRREPGGPWMVVSHG